MKRTSIAGILFAVVLLAACTPALPAMYDRVMVIDGVAYAGRLSGSGFTAHIYLQSADGLAWTDAQRADLLVARAELPLSACLATDSAHCFRVTGSKIIEESSDGGATWRVSWALTGGRETFLWRTLSANYGYVQMTDDQVGARDVTVLSSGGRERVIVALGLAGMLVRDEDGAWRSVGRPGELPYFQASDVVSWSFRGSLLTELAAAAALCLWVMNAGHATVVKPNARRRFAIMLVLPVVIVAAQAVAANLILGSPGMLSQFNGQFVLNALMVIATLLLVQVLFQAAARPLAALIGGTGGSWRPIAGIIVSALLLIAVIGIGYNNPLTLGWAISMVLGAVLALELLGQIIAVVMTRTALARAGLAAIGPVLVTALALTPLALWALGVTDQYVFALLVACALAIAGHGLLLRQLRAHSANARAVVSR